MFWIAGVTPTNQLVNNTTAMDMEVPRQLISSARANHLHTCTTATTATL